MNNCTNMKKIEPTKKYILEEKMKTVWLLSWRGYGPTQISDIMNGLDRTWIHALVERMPKNWEPKLEKILK